MSGSEKFWLIIGIIFVLFMNYLFWFSGVACSDDKTSFIEIFTVLVTALINVALILFSGVMFFTKFLPRFNKYLDEKF